ncbi:YPDG domain-containing protein, partial [Corynebacterium afermentans]|uniref:YPDG domain-containing protein n=1 Tax=Corynebacterium afermentans TaxID=38286 RepID=UPI0025729B35
MKKNFIARRRGTSVAAAALSFALVAPFAQPVAFAQETTAASAPTEEAAPAAEESGIIDADMIASGRVTKAANLTDAHGVGKGLISGHVFMTGLRGNPSTAYDNNNVKLDGITVYAQFRDKDGSYSPIFSAKTHTLPDVVGGNGGKGTFAFGTGDKGITWTDEQGKEHTWAARTDQQHRIWVEPFTNERGNRVEMFRQANGYVPGSFNGLAEAPLGSFGVADANMQLMGAFMREVPPNHETSWMAAKGDKLVEDPKGPDPKAALQGPESNILSGEVWLETGGYPDAGFPATGPKNESKDPAADGYTVYASTLTKDGAAANKKLHEQFEDDPDKLAEETKKMLEAHPEYILKTVYGKTDKEGKYSLRFGDYTDKNQTREDFLNPQHVFVWVENKKGEVQSGYTGFHTPVFQVFNGGGNFRPLSTPGENQVETSLVSDQGKPRYGKPLNKIYNVNHAIMPYAPVTITADYNATDKPAAPGTTVTPEFSGELSDLPSKVEWRDKNGKVVKTCDIDQSKTAKDQVAACTFDIPDDAKKGDFYSVVVVSGNNDVSAWSVLVTDKASDEFEPAYEDKLVVPGKETKSSPTFKDKDGKDAKAPEGSKFEITDGFTAPEGYVVEIDESTGEITVTFPDGSKLNKDTDEEFDVPVTVTYPDGSKDDAKAKFKLDTDGDGKPDSEDDDDDNDGIPDKDDSNPKVPNQNTEFEPGYEDGSGKPGEDVKVPAPKFKDKDDKDTKAPEGTTFKPGDKAPEGVKVDENTGEITVPVPEDAKPGDKITVPVEVTYPDGSKDTVDVPVTVEEPDAPDTKQNDEFEPGYEDGSGKPGEDVTVPAPKFKDKDDKDTKAPEGTTFKPGDKAPEGVKVDENTGEITVPVPEDAKPGDKITVPVEVTY